MVVDTKDKNKYFTNAEIQSPESRENKLFENFSSKLKTVITNSYGWKEILANQSLDTIKNRDDLEKLPITRKSSLIDLQQKNPPYGGLNSKEPSEFDYMFASPGPIYEPGEKGDFWNIASSLYAAGIRKGNVVYNTFSYHLGPAGIMFGNAANHLGCTVIAGGIGNTDLQIATIETLKPNFYLGTPSFLKIILDKTRKNKSDLSCIKNALVGAEAFPEDLRNYFSKEFSICPLQMYGTAEVGCIAFETKNNQGKVNTGMVLEENIIIEIVRPGTLKNVSKGEVGEVVVTKLNTNYPMIRLATGDLSAIIEEPSPCGRTNTRIKGWMGRAEQSTKVKGLFITPNQVNKITDNFKAISKVRLVINKKNFLDDPKLICEVNSSKNINKTEIKEFFKEKFKLNVHVEIVEKGIIANDGIVIEDRRNIN